MALQVLGNPPTAGREHWLGQTLEDFPVTFQGSCVRTQAQVQAAMDAYQTGVRSCQAMLREAEEKRELLRPFHRRQKIEYAKRDAWLGVYARLEAERWSEALSEARTSLAAARRSHAQHPGRAARVCALKLAEDAVSESVAKAQSAQANYRRHLALHPGQSERILQKAGVVIAGLSAAGTTTAEASRACRMANEAEAEAQHALTRASKGFRPMGTEMTPPSDGDHCYLQYKALARRCRQRQSEEKGEPPPRLLLREPPCTPHSRRIGLDPSRTVRRCVAPAQADRAALCTRRGARLPRPAAPRAA